MNGKPSFWSELQRRHVYKVGAAYAVAGWLIVQVVTQVFPIFDVPALGQRVIVLLIVAGFPIALLLSWLFDITSTGVVRTDKPSQEGETDHSKRQRLSRDRGLSYLLGGLLLLAVAWLVVERTVLRSAPPDRGDLAKSVAVLPLVNTSGDATNEYFSDGLSEELIAVLAKIPELKVIGRSSSFLFKGKSGDARTIGEKLGVSRLIEGSVRKQGDHVRIIAELINAADGRELWSETYDRELKDVFAVQSEIALAVAEQMKVKLLGLRPKSDAAPSNDNLAAHNAALQSDFYFQQQTDETVSQAIKYLEEAVRLDPNYGLAYAKLSQAWRQYAATFGANDATKAYAEAQSAGEKAVSLAPDTVEARKAVGWLAMTPRLDFPTAEKEFRRALELAPGDAGAKTGLGYSLLAQGKLDEAERVCREATALDPLFVTAWFNRGRLAVGTGHYDEAEQIFRKVLEFQPHASRLHLYLAMIEILRNNPTEAAKQAELEPDGFWREFALTMTQQVKQDRAAADATLVSFTGKYAVNGAFQVAAVYALRKQPTEMFQWLDTSLATHDSGLSQLAVAPFFSPYYNDPRYKVLCRKLNVQLPQSVAKH